MENNIRFRNHFSMVLPNVKGILWLILIAVINAFTSEDIEEVMVTAGVWGALILVLLFYQIFIWAKTWITIGEQSIIIERNTLFSHKKNTIGIANISNVNLEQSLFGMLLGTCKLKLDTNSLSTAETTDVTIVLKKAKAEEVKRLLLRRIEGGGADAANVAAVPPKAIEAEGDTQRKAPDASAVASVRISTKDIILHGLYSSRFMYAIFLPLFILFELVSEFAEEGDVEAIIDEVGALAAETIGLGILILTAVIAWALLATVVSLVRNAVRYWDFGIERQKTKLVLNYGLTKKVNYSIPVDKIQAIVLKQSIIARLCRRYMVEVINVGMNDDEKEAQVFLLPYSKRAVLKEQLQQLLPEFSACLEVQAERQPKSVWIVWLWSAFIYILIMGGVLFGVAELAPTFFGVACGGIAVLSVAILAVKLMSYKTKGTGLGKEVLLAVTGSFSRQYMYIKYANIQYIVLKQNFVAKRFGIQKGVAMLLASARNQAQEIPYLREEKIEKILTNLTLYSYIV